MNVQGPAVLGGRAPVAKWAGGARGAEGDRPLGAHRPDMPRRAGHWAVVLAEDEVVEGEPARHRRAQRHRLDDRVVPGRLVVRAGLAGAVAGVAVDFQALAVLPVAGRLVPAPAKPVAGGRLDAVVPVRAPLPPRPPHPPT